MRLSPEPQVSVAPNTHLDRKPLRECCAHEFSPSDWKVWLYRDTRADACPTPAPIYDAPDLCTYTLHEAGSVGEAPRERDWESRTRTRAFTVPVLPHAHTKSYQVRAFTGIVWTHAHTHTPKSD